MLFEKIRYELDITFLQGEPQQNLDYCWERIKREYFPMQLSATCKFTNITLSMFCDPTRPRGSHPRLKGRAAEIKSIMPALLWCWRHVAPNDNDWWAQVELALKCTVFLDDTMDAHKDEDVLPREAAQQFQSAGFALNTCMNSLLEHYANLGPDSEYLFNIVPENHFLAHLCLMSYYINPRCAWCYMGEDMMHQMRRLSSGVARGNSHKQAGRKLMLWYGQGIARLLAD